MFDKGSPTITAVQATEAEIAQVRAMSIIVRKAWYCSRNGWDYDGADIQEDMAKVGLLTVRPATEVEAEAADCDPGSNLFFPSDLMKELAR